VEIKKIQVIGAEDMNGNIRNFAWPITTVGKYDYRALNECVEKYKGKFLGKKIVIFGAGIRGTSFSIWLSDMGYENIVFTDNNEMKIGGYINKFPILAYQDIIYMKDEIVVIVSVENGYVIMEQLEQSGFVKNENAFFIENHLNSDYVKEFSRKGDFDIVAMGDCGFTDISIKDENHDNISEILEKAVGREHIKVLAIHAMGMRAFYNIFKAHIDHISIPKKLLLMANFETFTGKQHLLPRSQHANLINLISKEIKHSDKELCEYAKVTNERFSNFRMDYFTSADSNMNVENRERNDRIVIKMNYMYSLKRDNEGIVYLEKMLNLCKKNGIEPHVFIPPVNYMYAEGLFGEAFSNAYQRNVSYLKEIVEDHNYSILDLSFILKEYQFADTHTIDETANYEGRKLVVRKLLAELGKGE
jgi:hypothetical protein